VSAPEKRRSRVAKSVCIGVGVIAGSASLAGGLRLAERFSDGGEAGDQLVGSGASDDPGLRHVHALGAIRPTLLQVSCGAAAIEAGEHAA
jgi:hypothetical protein